MSLLYFILSATDLEAYCLQVCGLSDYFLPPELRAAALMARAAKLPFDTRPPLLWAVEDWIRLAASAVIGVRTVGGVVFLVIIFTFVVRNVAGIGNGANNRYSLRIRLQRWWSKFSIKYNLVNYWANLNRIKVQARH